MDRAAEVVPLVVVSGTVPSVVEPSVNVTVPVGAGVSGEATVAVSVTDWPNWVLLGVGTSPMVGVALLTTCESVPLTGLGW